MTNCESAPPGDPGGGFSALQDQWLEEAKRADRRREPMLINTRLLWSSVPENSLVFYERLNAVLGEAGFDRAVEALCERHYARGVGRPSIPPGC